MNNIPTAVHRRFDIDVDKAGDCWVWLGYVESTGYGRLVVNGKNRYAHRIAYQLHFGEVDERAEIDHVCRNRACVNPDHLRPTSRSQNQQNLSPLTPNTASGVRGVTWHKRSNRWRSRVKLNGRFVHESYHLTIAEARQAVVTARLRYMTHNDSDRALPTQP